MEISIEYSADYSHIEKVAFEGLTGREYVSSTKDALNVMKIRNPALKFSDDAKAGCFNEMTDAEYKRMLEMVKCLKSLWSYPDASEDDGNAVEMSVLMLLANAIRLISRQNAKLREYKEEIEDALYG